MQVTFGIINRTERVRIGELVDEGALREQLDHVRSLSLSRGESTWLRGNNFYGKRQMFSSDFMEWLENFRFPPYHLEKRDGQYELIFEGHWVETTMWEIPALAILNELRSRAVLRGMGRFELQVLYARAMTRVWEKIERLRALGRPSIADFGTRRRHGFLWQDWCVQAMMEGLGPSFLGTSNCLIALRREVEAVGTNAHELPMVYAALAESDEELAGSPYEVLKDWQEDYDGNLLVILPDTFGTSGFLRHAPEWMSRWTGIRIDLEGAALRRAGRKPSPGGARAARTSTKKLAIIFSDGLDVETIVKVSPSAILRPHAARLWLGHAAHQ